MPNPDKPEQIATKAPRHKGNLQLLFIFASLRLGGENNLPYHLPKPDPPSAENKLPQRHQDTKETFGYCSSLRLSVLVA
jgi:hypothetical protein